jgi:hypothetical protein
MGPALASRQDPEASMLTALERLAPLARFPPALAGCQDPEASILTTVEQLNLLGRFMPTLAGRHEPEASRLNALTATERHWLASHRR